VRRRRSDYNPRHAVPLVFELMPRQSPAAAQQAALPGIRLDVWLWAARFFKTRALAKQAIETGRIAVDGHAAHKAAKLVHAGNHLHIARGEERFEIEVLKLCEQRGPAGAAQLCYRETQASRQAREAAAAERRLAAAGYTKPATKPDKRARRLIRALGDIDAM
jgi:ribosome-associated heat shock protein Hsp15